MDSFSSDREPPEWDSAVGLKCPKEDNVIGRTAVKSYPLCLHVVVGLAYIARFLGKNGVFTCDIQIIHPLMVS